MALFTIPPLHLDRRVLRGVPRPGLCMALGVSLFAVPRPVIRAQAAPIQPAAPTLPTPASTPVPSAALPPASLADMRIETFGPERGYVVGVENVVLLCVVRNTGQAALPADSLRLRCYPISGLDYTSGNLLPTLPALAPGQAVAYRWRLASSDAKVVLAAGVALERIEGAGAGGPGAGTEGAAGMSPVGRPEQGTDTAAGSEIENRKSKIENLASPLLAFTIVPRLPRAPGFGDAPVLKDALPHADTRDGVALLLNNRVGARIQTGMGRDCLLQLAAREGAGWRIAALSLPLLRANAGEDGQIPWWQSFRCQSLRAREDRDGATLTLTGTLGGACRVEITFESRPDTCIVSGRARLTATRALRLAGVQLPALCAVVDDRSGNAPRQDGSPLLLADTPSLLADDARIAAAHAGATTYGLTWPADPPLPGWKWSRLPPGDGAYTLNLGVQATGSPVGDLVPAGATVEFAFRLFAFAPSDTVRDALRFQFP